MGQFFSHVSSGVSQRPQIHAFRLEMLAQNDLRFVDLTLLVFATFSRDENLGSDLAKPALSPRKTYAKHLSASIHSAAGVVSSFAPCAPFLPPPAASESHLRRAPGAKKPQTCVFSTLVSFQIIKPPHRDAIADERSVTRASTTARALGHFSLTNAPVAVAVAVRIAIRRLIRTRT